MAIVFERAYKASDGKCYATLEEAQEIEIKEFLKTHVPSNPAVSDVITAIVAHKALVVDILTLNDSSRPKARGKSKTRKPKLVEQPELPKAV